MPSTGQSRRRHFPSAAAAEDVARTNLEFRAEAVGILAASRPVHIAIGIAIQDQVVAGRGAEIDAAALVFVRAALLDRVVMTSDVDAAAGGADDFKAHDVPVVALHDNAAHALFEFLRGEIEERPLVVGPFDSNRRFGGAAGTQPHGLVVLVSSTGDADDVAGLSPLRSLGETAKWRGGSSSGAGLARWRHEERRGFDCGNR